MKFKVKFIFEGEMADELPSELKEYFVKEFVERRAIFVDEVNPMYEVWNKEFDSMYPDLDGYTDEYTNFIAEKHKNPLDKANSAYILLDEVELRSDLSRCGDIYGYVKKLDVSIYCTLV